MIDTAMQIEVDRLLTLSRREHEMYLWHSPRMEPNTQGGGVRRRDGDALEASARVKAAAQARMQADRIDPLHESPAWGDESTTHDHRALVMEYLDLLSR